MNSTSTRRTFLQATSAAALGTLIIPAYSREEPRAKKPIKIGQLGTAHAHAAGKMEIYRASPDFEVVGIVETDQFLRTEAENKETYRGLYWMTAKELLATPGLQAVAIETEISSLLPAAEECIAAGKHVHLDKPPGDDLHRFERLLDDATRRKLVVQLGYMYRYNPAVELMRDLLKKGWLGAPFEVQAVMSKVLSPASREPLTDYPGGIMFELGCHLVDLLVQALGKPKKVTAYPRHSSPDIDDNWPDNMLAVCEYPKATATLRSTALEVDGTSRRHFTLCGSQGTIHIQPLDRPTVTLTLDRDRGSYKKGTQTIEFEPYQRYVGDAADLARIIGGEAKAAFRPTHDLAVQETVLRASGLM